VDDSGETSVFVIGAPAPAETFAPPAGGVDVRSRAALRPLPPSVAKRALDILGALGGLIFLAPMLLIVAIAIKLESRGPVIFRQRRTGFDGKPFIIYKFRSMRAADDGDKVVQARKGDPRVTRVGALIRRTSIDELPQLMNILKGEMSLVGPRPHALAHDEYYGRRIPGYDLRFYAKPGLTGYAQVSGFRGETADPSLMARRIQFDLEYIRTWSIWLDIEILLRTFITIHSDPAAY
jgi:putative colanic acid biosynthesis UDP-glucose lipid carrier transferase